MHLLQAQPGAISDGSEPFDLGQSPADIIIISAADSELAALSQAFAHMQTGRDTRSDITLRLANLNHLAHPFSIDKYIDDTAEHAKLVIIRLLGGRAYWTYGLEQCELRLKAKGIKLVVLPGDDKPDHELMAVSNLDIEAYTQFHSYFTEAGPENIANALRFAQSLIDETIEVPPLPKPLLRAGLYSPNEIAPDLDTLKNAYWQEGQPVAAIIFYRALLEGSGLNPIHRLMKSLSAEGLNPLPIFVASLKDSLCQSVLDHLFDQAPPDIILNTTSFSVSSPQILDNWDQAEEDLPSSPLANPLAKANCPIFQLILSTSVYEDWDQGLHGLPPRDIAMNIALPEVDGRVITRAVSFKNEAYFDELTQCPIASYRAIGDRITFVVQLAANWVRLGRKPESERKVALILANYPNKDGRLANGVGLDTPAATINVLKALEGANYKIEHAPKTSDQLMKMILAGPTNWRVDQPQKTGGQRFGIDAYMAYYKELPYDLRTAIEDRWGKPVEDPFIEQDAFVLSIFTFGHAIVGVQPARGYNIDPQDTYHSPDLVPPHNYLAFYFWLRHHYRADCFIHMGKHGNLEWLPGKAVALSETCWPEAILGPHPHLYPFIVNDPGEGTQAKRRTHAVIIDHLTPPLTRAETYGPLRDLEALVDEYYQASGLDYRRLKVLRQQILDLSQDHNIDLDAGIKAKDSIEDKLALLDNYLCELKESQIRDGLHIFGQPPTGRLADDLIIALARLPRGLGRGKDKSLLHAMVNDLGFDAEFDPLDCEMAANWLGSKPDILMEITDELWRSNGDTIERLELLAAQFVSGAKQCPQDWVQTDKVLQEITTRIRPLVESCGAHEMSGLLKGLSGRFVAPGPSGAPTRGRLDVLPTGRNFFSVDSRGLPTPTAYELGQKSAERVIERYLQDEGDWLKAIILTAWGTANMRTGGDDLAQALAFMGVRPTWDGASLRVTGFEIVPLAELGRPRVDVTLRVSGFFRDAFPAQMDLIASAAKAIMELDEPEDQNPAAARYRQEKSELGERASLRVFGSKPGAYGAGLQALIDERIWEKRSDFGDSYIEWGAYAYGSGQEGAHAETELKTRLNQVDAVVQNQDNREHDLLDSDDYYQFEGGAAAAIESVKGEMPIIYHNDHSRPERPVVRALDEEISRVIRSRVVNPKWINGVKRHGYKGAFEMAATLDYLFAFSATCDAVKSHHFDLVHKAYLEDDETRDFIQASNPAALQEMASRFLEAIDRGLWQPKSNSAQALLEQLRKGTNSG